MMKGKFYDFRLKNASSMLVCGPTQAGKSTFVHGLLNNLHILEVEPKNIYWFYGQYNEDLFLKPYVLMRDYLKLLEILNLIV